METIPRRALWAVVAALIGLAGLGAYQGMRRGAADQDSVEAGVLPTTAALPGAKAASPLSDAGGLTEAQVREIARQEARSLLTRPGPAPANDAADSDASERPLTPAASAPRLATPGAERPAASPPPASAAAGDAGQPPLF